MPKKIEAPGLAITCHGNMENVNISLGTLDINPRREALIHIDNLWAKSGHNPIAFGVFIRESHRGLAKALVAEFKAEGDKFMSLHKEALLKGWVPSRDELLRAFKESGTVCFTLGVLTLGGPNGAAFDHHRLQALLDNLS